MPDQTFKIPYSKSELIFTLPPSMQASLAVSQPATPLRDISKAISHALDQPIGSPPLRELARPGDCACIVFTDITRTNPDHLLVPALLYELEQAGVKDQDITLLCGIGMHRPSTKEE